MLCRRNSAIAEFFADLPFELFGSGAIKYRCGFPGTTAPSVRGSRLVKGIPPGTHLAASVSNIALDDGNHRIHDLHLLGGMNSRSLELSELF